jgi:hypothetical protein
VGAVLLLFALTALAGRRLALTFNTHGPVLGRLAAIAPATVAAALLIPLGVLHADLPATLPSGSPQGTVRQYLGALADGDGIGACGVLGTGAQHRVQAGSPSDASCSAVLADTSLRLGGRLVTDAAQLDALHYAVSARGRDRQVVVSDTAGRLRFLLRPATASERANGFAPFTPWRIVAGRP